MNISVKNIKKAFNDTVVLDDISFDLNETEVVSILGPSGCGKTTLLNIIASLQEADFGEILIDSKENLFRLGYMMQEESLLSWRTLAENAVLGVEVVLGKSNNAKKQLDQYFDVFELKKNKNTYPDQASAGMKQRVALIRTLLLEPSLLLLDEPFSNLDFDIKLKIQLLLLQYQQKHRAPILFVTHDIEDAIALSNKVIILSNKPTKVKSEISINLGMPKLDPVERRKSQHFGQYFAQIWDQLKYIK